MWEVNLMRETESFREEPKPKKTDLVLTEISMRLALQLCMRQCRVIDVVVIVHKAVLELLSL